MKSTSGYRPDIDGLRAIAILGVVVFHAFPNALAGGFVGVDVFFVISGFLITKIIIVELGRDEFSIVEFYFRRIRRIFPSLVAMLIAVFIIAWFTLLKEELASFGKHLQASVFFIQNFNLASEVGYFDLSADKKPLLHLWSLAIEEQFYLVWPLILIFVSRTPSYWRMGACALLILISFKLNIYYSKLEPTKAFYYSPVRFWELLIGALVSIVSLNTKIIHKLEQSNFFQIFFSLSGVALLIAGFVFINRGNSSVSFPKYIVLLPTLGTLSLILSKNSYINRQILSNRAMVFLGLVSYPLYLWHWPLLSLLRMTSEGSAPSSEQKALSAGVAVIISFILATATYILIEKPIQKYFKLHQFKVVFFCCLSLAFLGGLGAYTELKNGFPQRAAANRLDYSSYEPHPVESHLVDCRNQIKLVGVETCLTNSDDYQKIDVAIIGDSHTTSLIDLLNFHFQNQSKKIILLETGSTIGFRGIGTIMGGEYAIDGEIRSLDNAYDWALAHGAQVFVLADRGPFYLTGREIESKSQPLRIADRLDKSEGNPETIFERGLRRTLRELTSRNKKIVFVFDNPEFPFDPPSYCFGRPFSLFEHNTVGACTISRGIVENRQRQYRELVQKVLKDFPSVIKFDPEPFICDVDACSAIQDHSMLYNDNNHFSRAGAMWFADKLNF